jgi:hypothetical protein
VDSGGCPDQSKILSERISRRAVIGRFAAAGATVGVLATVWGRTVRAQSAPAASEPAGVQPNHFVLEGDETHIVFDTTTEAGMPQLTYDGPYGSQSFSGDGVTIEDAALGRMVTVYLGAFEDQGDLWLTVLVPKFVPTTLDQDPAPFETLAIEKWLVSTIAGPPRKGALEAYRVLDMEGTAELVVS